MEGDCVVVVAGGREEAVGMGGAQGGEESVAVTSAEGLDLGHIMYLPYLTDEETGPQN